MWRLLINVPAEITRHVSALAGGGVRLERGACMPVEPIRDSRRKAAEPVSVSAPHRESLARPTGPGLLTYLFVPKVPKATHTVDTLRLRCLPTRQYMVLTFLSPTHHTHSKIAHKTCPACLGARAPSSRTLTDPVVPSLAHWPQIESTCCTRRFTALSTSTDEYQHC